ncbi:MAG: hypothetical protein NZZ60_03905 [Bacteroidia bacterium]|nr:hypothetical protein [Bacteroidia bacterium]MCX7652479.1 hypothetical protein [Bacteroidia bacterium]MDW8416881.1 hypothetical protein [Bacteroidia bacterium]
MGRYIIEWVLFLKYLSIFLMSGFKFMVGVAMSMAMRLGFWEQFLITVTGGIAGVILFTYLGDKLRQWIAHRRKRPTRASPSPKWAQLWEKYGLWGVAFLTPPILSPPIGTAIALAFGTPRPIIIQRFGIAMVVWGGLFAGVWDWLRSLF